MVFIKIKENKCPLKGPNSLQNSEKRIIQKCGGGMLVYVVRLMAIIWLVSMIVLILYLVVWIIITLLKVSEISREDNDSVYDLEFLLIILRFIKNIAWNIFIILGIIFFILYLLWLFFTYSPLGWLVRPFLYPLFDPIFCVCWETGVFRIFEVLLGGLGLKLLIKAIINLGKGGKQQENNATNNKGNEIFEEFNKICSITDNKLECSSKQFEKASKSLYENVQIPVSIKLDDKTDTNPEKDVEFSTNDKMKMIEYQNCLAEYKQDSPIDSSTADVFNSLNKLKCYHKAMSVDINSYNDGTCVKSEKSSISKGVESIDSVKEDIFQKFKDAEDKARKSDNLKNTSNENYYKYEPEQQESSIDNQRRQKTDLDNYVNNLINTIRCSI